MPSTLDHLTDACARVLDVVATLGKADGGPRQLFAALGWDLPPGVEDIGLAALDLSALQRSLAALDAAKSADASDIELAARYADLLLQLGHALQQLRGAAAGLQASGDYLAKTNIRSEFIPRVASMLACARLGAAAPLPYLLLQCFGVINLRAHAADASIFQVQHVRAEIDWSALGRLFSDPVGLLAVRYGWGTPEFDAQGLLANLAALFDMLGEPARVRRVPRRVEEQLAGRFVPEADTDPATQIICSIRRGDEASGLDAGVSLLPVRASAPGATDAGLALCPFVFGTAALQFPIGDRIAIEFDSTVALDSGIALVFRPGREPLFKGGLMRPGGVVDSVEGRALVRLVYKAAAGGRHTLLALPGGGRVEATTLSFAAGVEASAGRVLPAFALRVGGGRLVLKPAEADAFVASALPAEGVGIDFDVGLRWSGAQGFAFEGSAGGAIDIRIDRTLLGLRVQRLHAELAASAQGLVIEVSLGAAFAVGPVQAVLDRVGVRVDLAAREGNIGPLDASVGFKPPSGVGLSIEAHGIASGGGFLFHDAAKSLYAGVVQLTLCERLTLKAFGLIATRLPDGRRGYSLIVLVTAEDFAPIPLGMGFRLLGIGGLVAVNRSFDEAALRSGLKNGTLGTLLFPRDPVGNAAALIAGLAAAFPARSGCHLLGVLAKIGWGTPTLVLLELALVVEFGARRRLLVLGRISSLLPSRENDLIRLNMDAIGVLDFDQGSAAIDAVLVDSRLAHVYALTGAMALRARWGAGPGSTFVLAVGGLHPRFQAPADMPKLDRIAIALSSGDNPRLVAQAYFAITANTVQFGARAALRAAAYGFAVEGEIGYDVLIQIAPLHFIADFMAKVQLKRGSSNLFSVSLEGELEGPRPLRVGGKAKFEIFWCDFTVRFDKTLVSGEKPPLPPALDLAGEIGHALASPSSWTTRSAGAHGVALRKLPEASAALVLDPLGVIEVRQQVAPLNTARDIDRFGGAPLSGARRFTLAATLQGETQQTAPLRDRFAPAQFFAMSDQDKLAAPSFEEMDAGIAIGSDALLLDEAIAAPLAYRSIVVDAMPQPADTPSDYTLPATRLAALACTGAVARAALRRTGGARFRNAAAPPAATLRETSWSIAVLDPAAAAAQAPSGSQSWSEAHALLATLNRAAATWQMLPGYEAQAA